MPNWINVPSDISLYFGFTYRITNLLNQKAYYGKKQFFSVTHRKVKGKTRKQTFKVESNWATYTSSSNSLNADIQTYGIQNFKFEILTLCKSKSELAFEESKLQWTYVPQGNCYNVRVEPIYFSAAICNSVVFV